MALASRASALVVILLLGFAAMRAQTSSDDEPVCTEQGLGKLQLTKEDTTILGLAIGTASLKDVEAKLGEADTLPRHGSASAPNTICYVSPTDGTVLTFGAGPMGGFVGITEFSIWSADAKFPSRSACHPSTAVSRKLSTNSGIKLGLTAGQLSKIIGTQATTKLGVTHYELMCRKEMTVDEIKGLSASERPYFDVSSFVEIHFMGSGASHIDIAKIVSY
jgi:hypothetical protein